MSLPLPALSAEFIQSRLAEDQPLFHGFDEAESRYLASIGISVPVGEFSLAVGSMVLQWIADNVSPESVTLETGAGYTTVLLAALAKHHYCCTMPPKEEVRIRAYLQRIGIPENKVTFAIGPSDVTLPRLQLNEPLDFAYVDGCHGYPYPAMDWHHIDQRLKVGGVLGMDNVELRPVREHCQFLDANGSYELIEELGDARFGYIVRFYRKLRDENREWLCQRYCQAPAPEGAANS